MQTIGVRIQALKRASTAEQVAAILHDVIVSGAMKPGDRLREVPLAESLGVSRAAVREAIQLLVRDGLVRHTMHRGALVAEIDAEDIGDIMRLKRIIEADGIHASNGAPDIELLRGTVEVLAECIRSGDADKVAEADLLFHKQLSGFLGSSRLERLCAQMHIELRLASYAATVADGQTARRILRDHRAIVSALRKGERENAVRLLLAHLDADEKRLLAMITPVAPEPSQAR